MTGRRGSLQERLEAKIERVPFAGCWFWTAGTLKTGYGAIGVDRTKIMSAHRAAWLTYRGEIPDGMWVLHRCDVRICVNPDHLFLGTNQDNVDDMMKKGRNAKGTDHGNARLTDDLVRKIRADSRPLREIADELGIGYVTAWEVRRRKKWRHVE